jgi:hypothetical protein
MTLLNKGKILELFSSTSLDFLSLFSKHFSSILFSSQNLSFSLN